MSLTDECVNRWAVRWEAEWGMAPDERQCGNMRVQFAEVVAA